MNGLPITSPDDIPQNINVIVTSSWYIDISKQLKEKGFVEGINFWDYYTFMVRYMYEKEQVVYIPSVGMTITEKCSLRCKYCIGNVPYNPHPADYDIQQIEESLEAFFNRNGKIGDLLLSGGDAFCHARLAEILESICEKHLNKHIERVKVAGNAIILPDKRLLGVLKQYEVVVRITDYRESTDRQRLEEHLKLFAEAGIEVEVINQGQWLKVWREETEFLKDKDAVRKMYQRCRYTGSSLIRNGKLYSCCVAGYNNDKVNIDFGRLDEYSYEDIVDFIIRGPYATGYEFCGKCYGMTNSNHNYVAKGEQM